MRLVADGKALNPCLFSHPASRPPRLRVAGCSWDGLVCWAIRPRPQGTHSCSTRGSGSKHRDIKGRGCFESVKREMLGLSQPAGGKDATPSGKDHTPSHLTFILCKHFLGGYWELGTDDARMNQAHYTSRSSETGEASQTLKRGDYTTI